MNNIEDFRDAEERSNDVKEAVQKAFDKLSEYYSKTDSSVYTITTSKHILDFAAPNHMTNMITNLLFTT